MLSNFNVEEPKNDARQPKREKNSVHLQLQVHLATSSARLWLFQLSTLFGMLSWPEYES